MNKKEFRYNVYRAMFCILRSEELLINIPQSPCSDPLLLARMHLMDAIELIDKENDL